MPVDVTPSTAILLIPGGAAVAMLIGLGIGLRRLVERRTQGRPESAPMLGLVGVAAIGAVLVSSLYVQLRTRTAYDVTPGRPETANVVPGSFRGIQIGDPTSTISREGGVPVIAGERQTAAPSLDWTQEGFFQPPARYDPVYRSDELTIYGDRSGRIAGFATTGPRAQTDRGLGTGDGLKLADERYPNLKCSRLSDADGYDYGQTSCKAKIAHDRFLWVGGNPIEAMSVTRWPAG